ncbi:MAG: diguanylate cyclase, partial [Deltaproteobacteria bacterium]|nr:diguanylate cyclase [Deltaproteobacteria bacterium]
MQPVENKVLVIDDNVVIRKLANTLLSKKNYTVITANSGKIGIELAEKEKPQVVLLDVMMPEMDGFAVCETLKAQETTRDIPIIMLTSKTESVDKIKGLEMGAVDYVTKPFDHGELQARVATQVKFKNLWDELQKKNQLLQDLIKKDSLTNLYNHRHFQESLADEFSRSQRYGHPLCCIMLDIDHFKQINDTYGHQAGDEILKSVASMLSFKMRDVDLAARYGGEEFALILPHTELKEGASMADRLRNDIATH